MKVSLFVALVGIDVLVGEIVASLGKLFFGFGQNDPIVGIVRIACDDRIKDPLHSIRRCGIAGRRFLYAAAESVTVLRLGARCVPGCVVCFS